MDPQTEELFWRTITSRHAPGRLGLPDYPDARVLSPGISTGRMLGGNLSMIVSLLGTPYQPDFANKVLFFEEVAEEPYRIDRMLTQLRNASVLSCSKGILAGQFVECVPKDTSRPSLSVDQILSRLAAGYPGPFVSNLQFGHVPKKATIAVGVMVRIDSNSGTIDCLEAAVA
jgi:muramoyltetrapeptide carboxypeptidase